MQIILTILGALCLSASLTHAEGPIQTASAEKKVLSTSQQRMVDCNKEASGKKGDERKTFMRTCMQAGKAIGTQQNRMKDCNASAGDKKGSERKTFMSECLKNK